MHKTYNQLALYKHGNLQPTSSINTKVSANGGPETSNSTFINTIAHGDHCKC